MKIICSACLLGCPCRYDGKSCYSPKVAALARDHELIPVCPEYFAGRPVPRVPIELSHGKVLSSDGRDVTEQLRQGSQTALNTALTLQADLAVLQPKSPSCGKGKIYDGTFSHTLTDGDGFFTRMLEEKGIPVFSADLL